MIILFYQIAVPFWHSFPERLREAGIRKRRKRAPRGGYPYRVPSMHVRRFCRAAPPIDRSRRLADGLPRRECPTGAPLPSTRRLQGHPNTHLTTACQPTCRHLRHRTEIMPMPPAPGERERQAFRRLGHARVFLAGFLAISANPPYIYAALRLVATLCT